MKWVIRGSWAEPTLGDGFLKKVHLRSQFVIGTLEQDLFEICLASLNSKIEIYLVSNHCNGNLPFSTRYLLDFGKWKWSIFHSYVCLPECSHSSSLLKSTQSNIFGTTYCTILQMLDTWLVGQIINTHHNTHLPMPTL